MAEEVTAPQVDTPQAGGSGSASAPSVPTSAAAAHATEEPTPAAPESPAPSGESAAAAHTAAQDATPPAGGSGRGNAPSVPEPTPVPDLASLSDDDYAKLVQPDVEGQEVDRSLITPMASALREAGIQPDVMAKVAPIYRKVVEEALAKDKAERDEKAKALAAETEKAFSADDWRDFGECYREHIAKDPELSWLVCHTELGSNKAFIRICNLVGASLRGERTPPASAAAASSQTDLDRAVFEQTVPKHLR